MQTITKPLGAILFATCIATSAAVADISRSVSVSVCNGKVHGQCIARKDADDPFTSVLFKCQVLGKDHYPEFMGAANIEGDFLVNVPGKVRLKEPRPGPVHAWHQYCRHMTGVYPYDRIEFFPRPFLYEASLPDALKCVVNAGDGFQP